VTATLTDFIQIINDPFESFSQTLSAFAKNKFDFVLCLASTATSDVAGISAAGATPGLRRLTPAVDAEALVLGHGLSLAQIPVSPWGIVSPVVITRACLAQMEIQANVVDCGAFVAPQMPHHSAGSTAGACVSSGQALPLNAVHDLFEKGKEFGQRVCAQEKTIVIAECVPGGTSSALAVLSALGFDVRRSLSSSIPDSNHDARWALAEKGLAIANKQCRLFNGLSIAAAVGDPMQPFVAGMVFGAQPGGAIMLAGGSQMLAVYALAARIALDLDLPFDPGATVVMTTKWVALDKTAALGKLSREIGAPFAASCPDFLQSRHPGLRAYEQGHVKEGVGAGAAMALWSLGGRSHGLMQAIDECYDQMLLGQ
jgi:uncharacterized protein (TIGR00303 family)